LIIRGRNALAPPSPADTGGCADAAGCAGAGAVNAELDGYCGGEEGRPTAGGDARSSDAYCAGGDWAHGRCVDAWGDAGFGIDGYWFWTAGWAFMATGPGTVPAPGLEFIATAGGFCAGWGTLFTGAG
jgi:hypothetical protein